MQTLNQIQKYAVIGGSCRLTFYAAASHLLFTARSDHGAPGILGMPTGEFLYADKLAKTLHRKAAEKCAPYTCWPNPLHKQGQ